MTGYESKSAAAADKNNWRCSHGWLRGEQCEICNAPRDAEIARLNEKVEFLARTNMLYSDWEHRETQVTSELIRKGIEEAKINAELRAEIEQLKAQLAQPAQEDEEVCPHCGSYCHERDELDKAEREIARLQKIIDAPKRKWVGLTDGEQMALLKDSDGKTRHWLVWEVEAKLKEKNNG